jgi:CRAL/TRIO domain
MLCITSGIDQAMFPELLGQMFIINTPGLFNMIWKVFAPLLDSRTTDKIKIYSKQKDWQPALLQLIDADVLPPGNSHVQLITLTITYYIQSRFIMMAYSRSH